jgi:hypothetical protein
VFAKARPLGSKHRRPATDVAPWSEDDFAALPARIAAFGRSLFSGPEERFCGGGWIRLPHASRYGERVYKRPSSTAVPATRTRRSPHIALAGPSSAAAWVAVRPE